jgi:predicted hydrocarbon binding protein
MNQLLDSLIHTPEEGRLSLQAARYLLIRPDILVDIQKALETHIPHDAAKVLADASQNDGITMAGRLREVFSYSAEQVLSSLTFMLGEAGWGVTTVEMLNVENGELVLKVQESPFAEIYGPSVNPVCHILSGIFQGVGTALFESEVEGQEIQCLARGDDVCRFVITAKPPA